MQLIEAKDRLGHGSEKGFMQRAKAAKAKTDELRQKVTPHIRQALHTTQQAALGAMHTRAAAQELGHQLGAVTGREKGTKTGIVGGGAAGLGAGVIGGTGVLKGGSNAIRSNLRNILKHRSKAGKLTVNNPVARKMLGKLSKNILRATPKGGKLGAVGVLGAGLLGAGIGGKALGGIGEVKGAEIGERKLGQAGSVAGGIAGAAGLGSAASRVTAAAASGAARGREKGQKRGFKLGGTVGAGLGLAGVSLLKAGKATSSGKVAGALLGAGLGAQIASSVLGKRHAEREAKKSASEAVLGGFSPEAAAILQKRVESAVTSARAAKRKAQFTVDALKRQFGI